MLMAEKIAFKLTFCGDGNIVVAKRVIGGEDGDTIGYKEGVIICITLIRQADLLPLVISFKAVAHKRFQGSI